MSEQQLNLFAPSQPCPTSIAAAESIQRDAATLRAQVYQYIQSRGDEGATDCEIQAALAMSGNTQRPRRVELLRMGRIEDSGRLRKTASNRNAVVWLAKKERNPT